MLYHNKRLSLRLRHTVMSSIKLVTLLVLLQVHLDGIESKLCNPSYDALERPALKVDFHQAPNFVLLQRKVKIQCKPFVSDGVFMEFRITWRRHAQDLYPQDHLKVNITENKTAIAENGCEGRSFTARIEVTAHMPIKGSTIWCCTVTRNKRYEKCAKSKVDMPCFEDFNRILTLTYDTQPDIVYGGNQIQFQCTQKLDILSYIQFGVVDSSGKTEVISDPASIYIESAIPIVHDECPMVEVKAKLKYTACDDLQGKKLTCCENKIYGGRFCYNTPAAIQVQWQPGSRQCGSSFVPQKCPGNEPAKVSVNGTFTPPMGEKLMFECVAYASGAYSIVVSRIRDMFGRQQTTIVPESLYEKHTYNLTQTGTCATRLTHIQLVETATLEMRGTFLLCCILVEAGRVCSVSPKIMPTFNLNTNAVVAPQDLTMAAASLPTYGRTVLLGSLFVGRLIGCQHLVDAF